jgi:dTDP-4-dehydrorhamnose reductase
MASDSARRPLLLLGGSGQLGWELRRSLPPLGQVVAPPRAQLDLADAARIRATVARINPSVIVNAAAYTAVDAAEQEQEQAHALNALAPAVLAEEAGRLGIPLIQYSTDYVFDGMKGAPYTEDDAPCPVNVYGVSKLAGERAVLASGCAHLVLRTGWLYGLRGKNFLRTILRLSASGDELRVVCDQIGAPTWTRMVAEATGQMLARFSSNGRYEVPAFAHGLYHLTAAGATSWHGFARAILTVYPGVQAGCSERVLAVSTAEYPLPARRPSFSVLDNCRARALLGLALPDWEEQLSLLCEDASNALGWVRP